MIISRRSGNRTHKELIFILHYIKFYTSLYILWLRSSSKTAYFTFCSMEKLKMYKYSTYIILLALWYHIICSSIPLQRTIPDYNNPEASAEDYYINKKLYRAELVRRTFILTFVLHTVRFIIFHTYRLSSTLTSIK